MTTILDTVRRIVGRRSKITRDEMVQIILAIGLPLEASTIGGRMTDGRYFLGSGRAEDCDFPAPEDEAEALAAAWARACGGITCISVFDARSDYGGCIRYDEPGSMSPLQYADLTFVPASLHDIAYIRQHARRVLIVRDTPLSYDVRRAEAAARAADEKRATRVRQIRQAIGEACDGTWTRILADGTLEMRDPNDGQSMDHRRKARHQYRYRDGRFVARLLPPEAVGDAWHDDTGVPEWEEIQPPGSGPVWDYFEAVAL